MTHPHAENPHPRPDEGLRLEPRLRRVDEGLARLARETGAPAGLSQRIYAASAPFLVATEGRDTTVRTRRRVVTSRRHRFAAAGRLGLAAAMGLAFIAGYQLLDRPVDSGDDVVRIFQGLQPISSEPDAFDEQYADATRVIEYGDLTYEEIERELSAIELVIKARR